MKFSFSMILQRPYKKFYYTFLQETIYKKNFRKIFRYKQFYYLIIKLTMIYREENKRIKFSKYYLEVYILNPILGKNVYKKEKVVISTTNLR